MDRNELDVAEAIAAYLTDPYAGGGDDRIASDAGTLTLHAEDGFRTVLRARTPADDYDVAVVVRRRAR